MPQIKGTITKCTFDNKYDKDGISYKDYVLLVDNKKYTTQINEQVYLQEGMKVILIVDNNNNASSGYCIKEGYGWGINRRKLEYKISTTEKFTYIEGVVTEKRKSTTGSFNRHMDYEGRNTEISYTIVMGDMDFHASVDEGDYLQVGMNIAAVLEKNTPVIILDKDANKYLGLSKPYFLVFILAIIGINVFVQSATFIPIENRTSVQIVLSTFLGLAAILNFLTFKKTNAAKNFLMVNMAK